MQFGTLGVCLFGKRSTNRLRPGLFLGTLRSRVLQITEECGRDWLAAGLRAEHGSFA